MQRIIAFVTLLSAGVFCVLPAHCEEIYMDENMLMMDLGSWKNPEQIVAQLETVLGSTLKEATDRGAAEPQVTLVVRRRHEASLQASRGGDLGYPRDFSASFGPNERRAVRYLLKTLAHEGIFTVMGRKADLENAGAEFDKKHPFQFYAEVFSDDELIVCMRKIRMRSLIWPDFSAGIVRCCTTESGYNNVTEAQALGLANTIGIDPNFILPAVRDQQWLDLLNILIATVPRRGNPGHFDS